MLSESTDDKICEQQDQSDGNVAITSGIDCDNNADSLDDSPTSTCMHTKLTIQQASSTDLSAIPSRSPAKVSDHMQRVKYQGMNLPQSPMSAVQHAVDKVSLTIRHG